MAKQQLLLLGISWPLNEDLVNWDLKSSREWQAWICMKPTLMNCDSLWMNLSGPGMPWEQEIRHRSACIAICIVLDILAIFSLIMISLTLNQSMRCKQIIIHQDTSPSCAGGSLYSASADRSVYAWSGYKGHCYNTFNFQLCVNLSIWGRSPCTTKL